jgi:hypothetical protein
MKFGISLPPFGDFADVRTLANSAREAEEAGWDGFFIWDHIFFDPSFQYRNGGDAAGAPPPLEGCPRNGIG